MIRESMKKLLPIGMLFLLVTGIAIATQIVSNQEPTLDTRSSANQESINHTTLIFETTSDPIAGEPFKVEVFVNPESDPEFAITGIDLILPFSQNDVAVPTKIEGTSAFDQVTQAKIDSQKGTVLFSANLSSLTGTQAPSTTTENLDDIRYPSENLNDIANPNCATPSPDFCTNGRIQYGGLDESGCPVTICATSADKVSGITTKTHIATIYYDAINAGEFGITPEFTSASSTTDTNIIGFMRAVDPTLQTPRERFLQESPTFQFPVKQVGTTTGSVTCWNRVIEDESGAPLWPDACKGDSSAEICAQVITPLTTEEAAGYNQWVSSGRPALPGCDQSTSPTPTPTPNTTPSPSASPDPDGDRITFNVKITLPNTTNYKTPLAIYTNYQGSELELVAFIRTESNGTFTFPTYYRNIHQGENTFYLLTPNHFPVNQKLTFTEVNPKNVSLTANFKTAGDIYHVYENGFPDGTINTFDISELLRRFGPTNEMGIGDLNNDGIVNTRDLAIIVSNIGSNTAVYLPEDSLEKNPFTSFNVQPSSSPAPSPNFSDRNPYPTPYSSQEPQMSAEPIRSPEPIPTVTPVQE